MVRKTLIALSLMCALGVGGAVMADKPAADKRPAAAKAAKVATPLRKKHRKHKPAKAMHKAAPAKTEGKKQS